MSRFLPLLATALILLTLLSTPCFASTARLLVHQTLDSHPGAPNTYYSGQQINVTLTIYNIGSGVAYNVVLDDEWMRNSDAFAVDSTAASSRTLKFAEIPAGEQRTTSFFITSKLQAPNQFDAQPVRVTYQNSQSSSAPQQTVYSTSTPELKIIESDVYARLTASHTTTFMTFYFLLSLFIILPAYKWYELSTSFVQGGQSKKQRKE